MYFTNAQRPLYNYSASVSPEASGWNPIYTGARRLSLCAAFLCVAVSSLWAGRVESRKAHRFPVCRHSNPHGLPAPIGIVVGRFPNSIQETAMLPTYNLTHAVRQYIHGNLSTQDAQYLDFSICLEVKNVLTVLSDAVDKANRLSTNSDIDSALETCAALIEFAEEIQPKGA